MAPSTTAHVYESLPSESPDQHSQEICSKQTPTVSANEADEEQPLLGNRDGQIGSPEDATPKLTFSVLTILLLGEFIAHADTTLIFASAPKIASELGNLGAASWLAASYTLAVCSTQPLYGKLSDVFGPQSLLLGAYFVLSCGCVICGVSTQMWQIIIGRAISGIGGSGVMTMASIIITNSVPKREIAQYRSYINLATTLGRSVGGPIGGLIADGMGWQWLFFLRIPIFAISVLMLSIGLKADTNAEPSHDDELRKTTLKVKLLQIDYIGAILMSSTIVMVVILIDQAGGGELTRTSILLVTLAGVFSQLFVYYEIFVATDPIFNLRILLKPNVALSYLINFLQVFGQVGMMFSLPLYFQVAEGASTAASGMHLVPAVVANTIGALASGAWIQKTQKYKVLLIFAGLFGGTTHILLYCFFNGATSTWESSFIMPAGMATGMAQSAAFVSMASCLSPSSIAMATGAFFLSASMGTATSITTTNLLMSTFFRYKLEAALPGPEYAEIIKRVRADVGYITGLQGHIREIVVGAFVGSLKTTYALGFSATAASSLTALFLRQIDL